MPQTKEDFARERFLHACEMVDRLKQARFAVYFKGHSEEIAVWHRQMSAWVHAKSEALEELRLVRLATPPRVKPVSLRARPAEIAALARRQSRVSGR
jgi:hypothetical protein